MTRMNVNFDKVFLVGSGSVAAECLRELKSNGEAA